MLKSVVSFLLQRYIGKYVENFNSDKVSVALFQGDVILENLPLRSDALLDVLDLPIVVKSGFIGRITLRVPYTQPRSQPWVFIIERVYAVAGPAQPKRHDKDRDMEHDVAKKQKKLEALENKWWRSIRPRSMSDAGGGASGYGAGWLSYGSSLAYSIVQNVQIHIKDVHIRYEDDTTIPSHTYAFGITIKELRAESTDSEWKANFASVLEAEVVYKLLYLTGFSLYWDSGAPLYGRLELADIQARLSSHVEESGDSKNDASKSEQHSFLLRPVDMSAKLKRYTSPLPLRSTDTPRIELEVSVKEVPLVLSGVQYREMVCFMNEYERWERRRQYRRWRPDKSVKQNPSAWWRFAYMAHKPAACSWDVALIRARQMVRYVRDYTAHLLLTPVETAAPPKFEDQSGVEESWSVGGVLALREVAMEQARRQLTIERERRASLPTPVAPPPPAPTRSWFSWWSYSAPGAVPSTIAPSSDRTEQEFMEALSLDENTDTLLRRDRVFLRLNLRLDACSFSLLSAPHRGLLLLKANQLMLGFESRPRFHSMLFTARVGSLKLRDARRPQDGGSALFPDLVAPKAPKERSGTPGGKEPFSRPEQEQALFFFLYELKPRDSTADYRLKINSEALQIVYNPKIFSEVVEVFKEPRSSYQIREAARQHYRQVAANARNNLRQLVQQMQRGERVAGERGRWEVELDVRAPQLLLPDRFEAPEGRPPPSALLCDFGRLAVRHWPLPRGRVEPSRPPGGEEEEAEDEDEEDEFCTPEGETSDEFFSMAGSTISGGTQMTSPGDLTESELEAHLYERYSVNLVDMEVLVGRLPDLVRQADLRCVRMQPGGAAAAAGGLHFVDKFSLMVQLRRRRVRGKDKDFPNLCIDGELPNFLLHLNDAKVLALQDCLATFQSRGPKADLPPSPDLPRPTRLSRRTRSWGPAPEMEEARLVSARFVMRRLVVQLESRGRPVAECQLNGAEATWTRRPRRHELDLCVRSLLVADAMSHLGQDYDLLVASHKHVWLDSLSGNISVIQSPTSPKSLQSPIEASSPLRPDAPGGGFSANFHRLLSSAVSAVTANLSTEDQRLPRASSDPLEDPELPALITVHYEWRDAVDGDGPSQKVDAKFSSLDVIGNQEALVEILAFFQRINPANAFKQREGEKRKKKERAALSAVTVPTECRVAFQRLNLLLIRVLDASDGERRACKIGTVTLTGANLEGLFGEAEFVTATLAGVQVLDLTTREPLHRIILSIGGLGEQEESESSLDESETTLEAETDAQPQAFTLTMYHESGSEHSGAHDYEVSARLASVCYLHAPQFLFEVGRCVSSFREYMNRLGRHLRHAAAEMALSMMAPAPGASFSDLESPDKTAAQALPSNIKLQMHMQSPVIVLPKTRTAKQMLIGHLGNISIVNGRPQGCEDLAEEMKAAEPEASELAEESGCVFLHFRDVSVRTLDLSDTHLPPADLLRLYKRGRAGAPVLQDTTLWLRVSRIERPAGFRADSGPQADPGEELSPGTMVGEEEPGPGLNDDKRPWLVVRSRMQQPLEMRLSKAAYEQILKSLDNLVFDKLDLEWEEREAAAAAAPMTAPEEAEEADEGLRLEFLFDLPKLAVVMSGDMDSARGMARLAMERFQCRVEKAEPFVKVFDVRLRSLVIEDLLQEPSAPHRFLLTSIDPSQRASSPPSTPLPKSDFLSQSCPESAEEESWDDSEDLFSPSLSGGAGAVPMSSSLPSELRSMTLPYPPVTRRRRSRVPRRATSPEACRTPPPSPSVERSEEGHRGSKQQQKQQKQQRSDELVRIRAKMVDKKSPAFKTQYNSTNRFIEVDFNTLLGTLNLNTWVLILDFLGLGAKIHDHDEVLRLGDNTKLVKALNRKADGEVEDIVNSEIQLEMNRFALVFNKPAYELARASMDRMVCRVSLRDGNLSLEGQLGGLQVDDTSPAGRLYPHRFLARPAAAAASEALLTFNFFKYALPDPGLRRAEDMRLRLRLASVCYVHTQRFAQELLAFVQNFSQQQDLMGRMRAALAGQKISERAPRAARLSLDIVAGAPVVLLPHSWLSDRLLVMWLGNFELQNCFLVSGAPGTLAADQTDADRQEEQRLADLRQRSMSRAAPREPSRTEATGAAEQAVSSPIIEKRPSFVERVTLGDPGPIEPLMLQSVYGSLQPAPSSILRMLHVPSSRLGETAPRPRSLLPPPAVPHRCLLDCLRIELRDMNIYAARRVTGEAGGELHFGAYSVVAEARRLVREKFALSLVAERNLEGEVSHSAPDWHLRGQLSSIHCSLDLSQYQLVRGVLEHNMGECLDDVQASKRLQAHQQDPTIQTVLTGRIWRGMAIRVDLCNVSIEVLSPRPSGELAPFAKIDLIRSRLIYESYSDQSKVTDLACPEVKILDTRFQHLPVNKRPNVFGVILQPLHRARSPEASCSRPNFLQLELHYLALADRNVFTILLDSIRLMCIFDWLLMTKAFLTTGPDNPWLLPEFAVFQTAVNRSEAKPADCHFEPLAAPVNKPTELVLVLEDTEFVVVEAASQRDTNAVILRGSAELCHRPHVAVEPLTSRLNNVEIFSCSLAAEDETALSIVDPTRLQLDLTRRKQETASALSSSSGLAAACDPLEQLPRLEFWFDCISCRLSYNDLKLFLAIIRSLPKQATEAAEPEAPRRPNSSSSKPDRPDMPDLPANFKAQSPYMRRLWSVEAIRRLLDLGFSRTDCEAALSRTDGDVEDAILDLVAQGPSPVADEGGERKGLSQTLSRYFSALKLKSKRENTSISLCIIDDCLDADVPLADLKLSNLFFEWNLGGHRVGQTRFTFATDYFNRRLSAWEPLVEPWNCDVEWRNELVNERLKFFLSFYSVSVLNLNLSSELVDLITQTRDKWNQEFRAGDHLPADVDPELLTPAGPRRRTPFVPFRLLNRTGSPVWFRTLTDSTDVSAQRAIGLPVALEDSVEGSSVSWSGQWLRLDVDGRADLIFPQEGERNKKRHQRSSVERAHRLVVQVDGWLATSPVMVDKVGIYFRSIRPDRQRVQFGDLQDTRVVFEVCKEGTAAKLIVVRSALQVANELSETVEVRMNSSSLVDGARSKSLLLDPNDTLPVPLKHVHSSLLIRPLGHWSVDFCREPIRWQEVQRPGTVQSLIRHCPPACDSRSVSPYRFCVELRRELFPAEPADFPGHTVTLVPPLTIVNLLPMELFFYLKGTLTDGTVQAGKEVPLNTVNMSEKIEFGVRLDRFPTCSELTIPPYVTDSCVLLRVYDERDRQLDLPVHVRVGRGGARCITVAAQYWLINRSGLPLVFRQDQCREEAAGQFREHEMARVLSPLLFSFPHEAAHLCAVRIGRQFHGALDVSQPAWSAELELDKPGVLTLPLRVRANEALRPDHVFNVGMEIRMGRGRYRATKVVTFTPRFLFENRTACRLLFAQRHMLAGQVDRTQNPEGVMSAHPRANLIYHWPRQDLDPLLCVRLADRADCRWSGGFLIQCVGSFCINLRCDRGQSIFLRIEVFLQGATYFVVFSDVDNLPLPYRLDNFSEVPVVFAQASVLDQTLRSLLRPHSSQLYAWDEPCQPAQLCLSVQGGGGGAVTYNLEQVGLGEELQYDCAVFVAMRATVGRHEEAEPLVLEYCAGSRRVRLKPKMPGTRYQLWELDREGHLFNLGSSGTGRAHAGAAALDSAPAGGSGPMVLDIADLAPQPAAAGKLVPLTVNRLDPKRKRTQRWSFQKEHPLLVCDAGLHVHVMVLSSGADVFCAAGGLAALEGRSDDLRRLSGVGVLRHLGGSGRLRVQVLTDGPTRVLQIEDSKSVREVRAVPLDEADSLGTWTAVESDEYSVPLSVMEENCLHANDWQLSLNMSEGLGISVINDSPEEVIYASLRGIKATYNRVGNSDFLEASIKNVQVDNQLLAGSVPVALFTPRPKHVPPAGAPVPAPAGIGSGDPVLSFAFHRELQNQWNAIIFKYFQFHLRKINVELEDRLLWRLVQFFRVHQRLTERADTSETEHEHQRLLAAATCTEQRHYYFGTIKVHFGVITLSVQKSTDLPPDLEAVRAVMPFPLLNFENARITLAPFEASHVFGTQLLLWREVTEHYRRELKNQAMRILVSFDFLGNPMGFINDLSEGVSGIVEDLNIPGFFRNVAHGVTNSSAKVTGTVSDIVSLTADRRYIARRQRIRDEAGKRGGSVAHLSAGMKSLGYGLVGGVTSVITQPYYGYSDDGIEGLATGFVKGLVGTVTKPVGGALDLLSGTFSSLRETAKSSSADRPDRSRQPRCCGTVGHPLQVYCREQAQGQRLMRQVLSSSQLEKLYLQMVLQSKQRQESVRILITDSGVHCIRTGPGRSGAGTAILMFSVDYATMTGCKASARDDRHYLDLGMVGRPEPIRVRCDSATIAEAVVQEVREAFCRSQDAHQTLLSPTR